ncbi:glutamine cyclotransferase [Bordetella bronchialis]|uniref:Glutamine cyclotransferase n=2 Tax=Bordetella bronchialis TaxID=463025 RepID=A0ABN4R2L6_9BORD|nr:glutamine cyclotransferase [Bordetella bronchialis]
MEHFIEDNAMKHAADIVRQLGPFPGVAAVHGLTYDGQHIWFASGDGLHCLDPDTGSTLRSFDMVANAGTAFDGRHIYQIADDRIHKVDPRNGRVLASIPAPPGPNSGMAWAEGFLWVGQYRDRKIVQVEPASGKVLRTIASNRFVTGITWVDGELWHGTWEGEASSLNQVDPETGESIQELDMPAGVGVSGLESNGGDLFFCGGGPSGLIRVVRKPGR